VLKGGYIRRSFPAVDGASGRSHVSAIHSVVVT
jgi:hypothetical protein